MLELPDGSSVDRFSKPKIALPENVFEGEVDFKLYEDAVEGTGKCFHCHTTVKYLLRLPPSDWLDGSPEKEMSAKANFFYGFRRNHQCPVIFSGKTDVDDFLKRFD